MRTKTRIDQLLAVVFELDQLVAGIKLLRSRIERNESGTLELLAATLHAALVQERLVQLQINDFNDELEKC